MATDQQSNFLTEQQLKERQEIIEFSKSFLNENNRMRMGWAVAQKFPHLFAIDANKADKQARIALTKSCAAALERTGEFIKTKEGDDDFEIQYNPGYELSQSVKSTNRLQRMVLKITIGISALTLLLQGINIWLNLSNQRKQEHLQRQLYNLTPPTIQIDSVVVHQSNTDTAK